MQSQATSKIWFITGISSGLGKALAEEDARSGDYVVGTFRNSEQVEAFNNPAKDRAFAVKLDMTRPGEIEQAVQMALARWERIDVLVNNAGFGFAGAIEEASIQEVREVFEANFFWESNLRLWNPAPSGRILRARHFGKLKRLSQIIRRQPERFGRE